jgi:transcriptional regulator with XRE-family HTH domain
MKDRLARARREAGFATPTDAARRFGWPPSTYLGYENGFREVSKKMLPIVCDAFRVNINWLLTGRGTMRGDLEAWFANYITGLDEKDLLRLRALIEIAFPKPDKPSEEEKV